MKNTKTIIALASILWLGCKDSNPEPQSQPNTKNIVVKSIDNLEVNFERLEGMLQGDEYAHHYDSLSQHYTSWGTYKEKQDSTETAGVILSSWNMGSSEPELLWEFRDSISCPKGLSSIKPELKDIKMVKLAGSDISSPAVAYIAGCGGDNEKNKLTLLVLDAGGAKRAKFYGYPLSYVPSGGIDSMDLRYKTSLGKGKHAEGKIENYYEFDQFAPSDRKLIMRLWRSALKHKLGIAESEPETPTQDSVKKS